MAKLESMQKKFNLRKPVCSQIAELAEEKGVSETAVVEMAVNNYYSQDTFAENIILGRMSVLEKKFSNLDSKTDTFYRFIHFILPNIFSRMAPLPKDKGERDVVLGNGSKIMYNLLLLFRRDEKKNHLSYMQSVYGDSQETLEETYDRKNGLSERVDG